MKPLFVSLYDHEPLASDLSEAIGADTAATELRRFPDGETYFRFDSELENREVIILCSLDRPDEKFLPLSFAAATARDLGAASVGLIAPYLAYMRQDRRFHPGEAVTSTCFAELLSGRVDWLVTVDPHLHRIGKLSDIYDVPAKVLHAAPLVADWVRKNVEAPVFIGPDAESAQWVSAVAADAGAPHVVLQKNRHGDRDVEVTIPDVEQWRDHTPVLVDDIASTARTMIEVVGHLDRLQMKPPVCVAVHGVFASNAYNDLCASGAARVVTSNTIHHETNAIDVSGLIADAVRAFLKS